MVIRDRISEFKALSGIIGQEADEVDFYVEDSLLSYSSSEDGERLDRFLTKVRRLQENCRLLESYVFDVGQKHSEILVDPRNDGKLKKELDSIMQSFQTLSETIRQDVKNLESEARNIEDDQRRVKDRSMAMEMRIRKTQILGLHYRLREILTGYNEVQVSYRDKCRRRIKSYMRLTGADVDEDEVDEIFHSGIIHQIPGQILMEQKKASRVLDDVESRQEDIIKLERSIKELHDLFQDIALLIEQQGEMVDNIERHIAMAQNSVIISGRYVTTAHIFQDKYAKKKVAFALVVTALILILIAIIAGSICSSSNRCSSSSAPIKVAPFNSSQ